MKVDFERVPVWASPREGSVVDALGLGWRGRRLVRAVEEETAKKYVNHPKLMFGATGAVRKRPVDLDVCCWPAFAPSGRKSKTPVP